MSRWKPTTTIFLNSTVSLVQAIEEWKHKKTNSIQFVPEYDQAGLDRVQI
jgi:hypothetical protein